MSAVVVDERNGLRLSDWSTAEPDPWRSERACKGLEPEEAVSIFFPTVQRGNSFNAYARARALCESCPVVSECLESVLAVPGWDHGFVGGTTPTQRRAIRRERGGAVFQCWCRFCGTSFESKLPYAAVCRSGECQRARHAQIVARWRKNA